MENEAVQLQATFDLGRRDGGSSTAAKCSSPCDNRGRPRARRGARRRGRRRRRLRRRRRGGARGGRIQGGEKTTRRRRRDGEGLEHRRRRNVSSAGIIYVYIYLRTSHVDDTPAGPERFVIARAAGGSGGSSCVFTTARRRRQRRSRVATRGPDPGVRPVPSDCHLVSHETRALCESPRERFALDMCTRGGPARTVPTLKSNARQSTNPFLFVFFVKKSS